MAWVDWTLWKRVRKLLGRRTVLRCTGGEGGIVVVR
jgi:hypothetical protein